MKLRSFLKFFIAALPFITVFVIVAAVIFYPKEHEKENAEKRIVRIWNVDTFEGGKGSRTAFLRNVARRVEKEREGVYFLISSYTAEGAEAAFSKGEAPDMLSFGVGLSTFAEKSLPLPYSFAGGDLEGKTLAYPWCRGGYSLFSLDERFDQEGRVAISVGGSNLPEVAARYAKIFGEEVESTAAYVGFLSGKYRYLLGTQRDICRFQTRGASVYEKKLSAYNDLYQYLSLLSNENREDCLAFFEVLLSKKVQSSLFEIGMFPVEGDESERTVNVFSDKNALENIRILAKQEVDEKNLDNFLKTI